MRILIPLFSPSTGSWGSLTRTMALAKKFQKEGHLVAFCASGFVRKTLIDKGFTVYEIPEIFMLGLPPYIAKKIFRNVDTMTPPVKEGKSFGNPWLLFFFVGYSTRKNLSRIVSAQLKSVHEFQADLIVTEMDLGAYITAFIAKKPLVTTYASIIHTGEKGFFYRKVEKTVHRVLKSFKIKDLPTISQLAFGPQVLKLIPSIPSLDTTNQSRKDVCYTGNLIEPIIDTSKVFIPEQGKRYIFCYFGTGSISIDQVNKVLPDALKMFDDLICFVASPFITTDYSVNQVHFVNFIEANALLPYCDATMCHGGLNTISQSLQAGVPLLLFPGSIFERRFNAHQVESLGGGWMGELSDFSVFWIQDKLQRIDTLKPRVQRLQDEFNRYHGVDTAYNRMIEWLGN